MKKTDIMTCCWLLAAAFLVIGTVAGADSDKKVIVDRYGEVWDVTQAASLGFDPDKFQYGIGRDTIKPVDDGALSTEDDTIFGSPRVIGVAGDGTSHAYVVRKLARHEIANTHLGDEAIAAGY